MNFGFLILDFGLAKKAVRQALRIEYLFWNDRKSKLQNLKWVGIFAIAIELTLCGAMTEAQQPARMYRLGFVSSSSRDQSPREEAFRRGLRDLGYVEAKNVVIEYRYADGRSDRLPAIFAKLIRLKVDIILTSGRLPSFVLHSRQREQFRSSCPGCR